MTIAEALALLDRTLPKPLNDLHTFVFQQTWEGKSYAEMADSSAYDEGYLKSIGSGLWKSLTQAMGQNVTKSNLRSSLEAHARQYANESLSTVPKQAPKLKTPNENLQHLSDVATLEQCLTTPCQDWGEAMDVFIFFGRRTELQTLYQWIAVDRCRLIAASGMGGMGKTALAVKAAEQVIDDRRERRVNNTNSLNTDSQPTDFEYVLWRSLRNAPP